MNSIFVEIEKYGIYFLDIGCSGLLDKKWSKLYSLMYYTGFDPNTEECARLNNQPHPFRKARYLTYALAAKSGQATMYKTKDIYCYSLLPPNHKWLNRFSYSDLFNEVGTENVICITLDDLVYKEGLKADIIKLDTQGLELPILQAGKELLKNVLCIEVENGFVENYNRRNNICRY